MRRTAAAEFEARAAAQKAREEEAAAAAALERPVPAPPKNPPRKGGGDNIPAWKRAKQSQTQAENEAILLNRIHRQTCGPRHERLRLKALYINIKYTQVFFHCLALRQ